MKFKILVLAGCFSFSQAVIYCNDVLVWNHHSLEINPDEHWCIKIMLTTITLLAITGGTC